MLWNSMSLMMVFRFTEEMDCGCHIRLNTNTANPKRLMLIVYSYARKRCAWKKCSRVIKLDEDLRNMVEADFLQMHDLFSRGWTPKVKQTRSCSSCSLRDLCLPELRKVKSAKAYIEERLKESGE